MKRLCLIFAVFLMTCPARTQWDEEVCH